MLFEKKSPTDFLEWPAKRSGWRVTNSWATSSTARCPRRQTPTPFALAWRKRSRISLSRSNRSCFPLVAMLQSRLGTRTKTSQTRVVAVYLPLYQAVTFPEMIDGILLRFRFDRPFERPFRNQFSELTPRPQHSVQKIPSNGMQNLAIIGGNWTKYCTVAKSVGQGRRIWTSVVIRACRLRSAAGSINSGRHILESRCAERCANDAFLTSFRGNVPCVFCVKKLVVCPQSSLYLQVFKVVQFFKFVSRNLHQLILAEFPLRARKNGRDEFFSATELKTLELSNRFCCVLLMTLFFSRLARPLQHQRTLIIWGDANSQ